MPHFENLSLRNPSALQAIGNWTYCGQVNGVSPRWIIAPQKTPHASYHLGQDLTSYLVTGRYDPSDASTRLCVSQPDTRTAFPNSDVTTFFYTHQVTTIDRYLWVAAANISGVPSLMALPEGVNIPAGPSGLWTDRSSTYPYAGNGYTGGMLIKKALTEGALYVAFVGAGAANKGGVCRAADTTTAINTGFIEQTNVGTRFTSIVLNGFGVANDGQVQFIATNVGVFKSTNAGATWTSQGTGPFSGATVGGHCEFTHVPAWGAGAWVMLCDEAVNGRGVWITSDNGTSWARSSLIGTNTQPTSLYFSSIESLDPTGKILVGFQGAAPCKIFISLNGGAKWAFVTSLIPPYYDMDSNPAALSSPPGPVIVINDNNRITLIWPGDTGDEGVFVSDSFGPMGPYYQNDPNVWSRP